MKRILIALLLCTSIAQAQVTIKGNKTTTIGTLETLEILTKVKVNVVGLINGRNATDFYKLYRTEDGQPVIVFAAKQADLGKLFTFVISDSTTSVVHEVDVIPTNAWQAAYDQDPDATELAKYLEFWQTTKATTTVELDKQLKALELKKLSKVRKLVTAYLTETLGNGDKPIANYAQPIIDRIAAIKVEEK